MQQPSELDSAKAKYWAWKLFWMLTLGLFIYMRLVAEGFRILFPTIAKGKIFGIDGAMIISLFMLIGVSYCWEKALCALLKIDGAFVGHSDSYRKLTLWLAAVLLFVDAALVYIALVRLTWSKGAVISFPAVLATVALVAVIVFVSLVSVNLKKPLLQQ